MTTREVWMMWHGGPSYAPGYVADDAVQVSSIAEAVQVCRDRDVNYDGRTPCAESSAWVWFYDPREVSDPYPDRIIERGPRGGLRVMPA